MSGGKRGVPVGSAMAGGGARDVTLARRRLLSRHPGGLKRGGERKSGSTPKRQKFTNSNVCVGCSFNKNAYILTQRALSSSLRPINRALCKRPFRMITLKQIQVQIRPRNWFASVDLKDAHFHIQITPHHR